MDVFLDVFEGCISLFYTMFYNLEQSGVLDPDNDIHLWCLHYVFLPIINRHLTNWRNAWVQHPLRSEGNSTPMQLWIRGLNRVWGSTSSISSEVFQGNFSCYGIDWEGPLPSTTEEAAEIPETRCPLDSLQLQTLAGMNLADVSIADALEQYHHVVQNVIQLLHEQQ